MPCWAIRSCCCLTSAFDLQPVLLSVWHLDDRALAPGDDKSLTAMAKSIVSEWENEGASDIDFEARTFEPSGDFSAEIQATVDFKVGPKRIRDAQRWLVDRRGSVWRLSVGGPETHFPGKTP